MQPACEVPSTPQALQVAAGHLQTQTSGNKGHLYNKKGQQDHHHVLMQPASQVPPRLKLCRQQWGTCSKTAAELIVLSLFGCC
jgi:hypothetical protein